MFQRRSTSPRSMTSRGLSPPNASFGVSSQWGMSSARTTSASFAWNRSVSRMRRSPGSSGFPPASQLAIALGVAGQA